MNWVLYTRKGCGLCEEMEHSLSLFSSNRENALPEYQTIDIDTDNELRERFNADVPLLLKHDEVILQYFFDETRLKQALMHD